jgi:SNF2 family DNA or RNA helicase
LTNITFSFHCLTSEYSEISPILNHPGCHKVAKGGKGQKISWKSNRDDDDRWIVHGLKKTEYNSLESTRNSPKFIVLAHIFALAFAADEKVLVYSKCLKTLDLIEEFLSFGNWKTRLGSLQKDYPDQRLGGLVRNVDYRRIDGNMDSGTRKDSVYEFNKNDRVRVFLISSLAGGIGINLVSVVLRCLVSRGRSSFVGLAF